jgi:long-chain acyl-CoA synthetase
LPLFHLFGLNIILISALKKKVTVVLHPRFEIDQVVKSLAEDGITHFAGVPTMYYYILKYPGIENIKFPKLRIGYCGGAPISVKILKEFEEKFNIYINEGYGSTELSGSICSTLPGQPRKIGSIGKPLQGVEMKVCDEMGNELPPNKVGELVIKSPTLMKGYLNKPNDTEEVIKNGWYYSGDLGYMDEDGFFYIVDRKKDMIIKGGYNIYPREIEEVIYQLPEVSEAAVVGIHDEAKGEIVRALIVLRSGHTLSKEDVAKHLEINLAKYKIPQEILFVDDLPKGPTGKIIKREIVKDWEKWNKERVIPE